MRHSALLAKAFPACRISSCRPSPARAPGSAEGSAATNWSLTLRESVCLAEPSPWPSEMTLRGRSIRFDMTGAEKKPTSTSRDTRKPFAALSTRTGIHMFLPPTFVARKSSTPHRFLFRRSFRNSGRPTSEYRSARTLTRTSGAFTTKEKSCVKRADGSASGVSGTTCYWSG